MKLLGIDVGTGGSRALVVDEGGRVVASATVEHAPFASPQTGWAEQDARDWWRASEEAVREVLSAEREDGRRLIYENERAIAFVPYFARYAYEVYVAPKQTRPSVAALTDEERRDFAEALRRVLVKFDNLWGIPFPYVMALHQAPTDGGDYAGFHFHVEFHPPLRRPNLLKYLAGPEIGGGNFLSDTSPEEKAAELRAAADVHYKHAARGSTR